MSTDQPNNEMPNHPPSRWMVIGRALQPAVHTVFTRILQITGAMLRAVLHLLVISLRWLGRQLYKLSFIAQLTDATVKRTAHTRATLAHHLTAWQIAWETAQREEPIALPQGKELEFLPAVLEVQESPPSPAGRAIALSIISVFGVALLWAMLGKIDIIAVAQGKVIQSGRSKVIQPLESGIIQAIHVRDGDRVKQGDLLIDLDTTAGADKERLTSEYYASLVEVARLRALLANKTHFEVPPKADPVLVKAERERLHDQLIEYRALKTQAQAYKTLYDKQAVARLSYLEIERKRAEKANEHTASLSAAEIRSKSLAQDLAKAETRARQQHLTAPINGVVQQLAVHTVGGVVTPAQQLLVIAPEDGLLEVEAILENKDIGFINEDQHAEIKIDAFPFTRYGVIEGKVLSISKDAVEVERVGLVYTARVTLNRSTMKIENKEIRLSPGMNVAVEIKTGKRRVIEYFLSPLIQAGQESVRER